MLDHLRLNNMDVRLMVMAIVLVVMGIVFQALTGRFLVAENIYNLAQQSAVVGIVCAAVVLVLVARQIDLSVGSALGFTGILMAWLMYSQSWPWQLAVLAGIAVSLVIGLYQGWLVAYLGIPSFVVTLGGLMSLRGGAFLVADGKTQPVVAPAFLMLGGGLDGSLGVFWSWVLCAVVIAWLFWRLYAARHSLLKHGLPPRPLWLDLLLGLAGALIVISLVAVLCSYQITDERPPQGIPIPLLIWGVEVLILSFIVHRTRFGRYVFAIGGNPEASALVGIPVKRVIVLTFILLSFVVTIAALVAVARLNAGTNSLGQNMELYAISATVIGGVALAGGSGSLLGSVLGALIVQSLENGLLLMDIGIGWRMVIIGQVLIVAVVFDVFYKKFTGDRT